MKKNGKKLLSLLLVLVMLLSLAPSAFAVEAEDAASEDEGFGSAWEGWEDEIPEEPAPAEEEQPAVEPAEEPVEEPAPAEEVPVIEEPAPAEEPVDEEPAPVEEPAVDEEIVIVEEEEPAEEEEESFPANTFYYVGGSGLRVTVDAPEGAFPEDAEMTVTELSPADVQAAIDASAYNGQVAFVAADISFADAEGNELQPEVPVVVTMRDDNLTALNNPMVLHIADSGEVSEVPLQLNLTPNAIQNGVLTVQSADVEWTDAEAAEPVSFSFEASSFSTYTIVGDNRSVTIHHGYVDGTGFHEFSSSDNSVYPRSLNTNSHSPAFLVYDFNGYKYKETRLSSPTGTAIAPILTKYNHTEWFTTYTDWVYWETGASNPSNYVPNNGNIYVIYEPKPAATTAVDTTPSGDDPVGPTPEVPELPAGKWVEPNGDGTYNITLSVTGHQEHQETVSKANVIVIFDTSSSMASTMGGGTAYSDSDRRMRIAKNAVKSLANTLLTKEDSDHNKLVQMALVGFDTKAYLSTNYTSDLSTFNAAVEALAYDSEGYGMTNWEDALLLANSLAVSQESPTYVVFVSDGDPTVRNTRTNLSDSQIGNGYLNIHFAGVFGGSSDIDRCFNAASPEARSIVTHNKLFYTIGVSSDATRMQEITNVAYGGTAPAGRYFPATSQQALNEAFDKIAAAVSENLGYTDVSVNDGVTDLTSIEAASLTGTPSDFVYRKGNNSDDPTQNAVWTGSDVPQAEVTEDNHVIWNVASIGTLEDGVTYSVTFTVWPSQESYDIIADINNGIIRDSDGNIVRTGSPAEAYAAQPESVQKQIVVDATGKYTLMTNTGCNVSYKYNGANGSNEVTVKKEGAMPLDTTYFGMHKDWQNEMDTRTAQVLTKEDGGNKYLIDGDGEWILDDDGNRIEYDSANPSAIAKEKAVYYVDLIVTKGNADYTEVRLTSDKDWTWAQMFVAPGVVTHAKNATSGDLTVRETGDDYTVREKPSESYYWELHAETYHPMVINGVACILQKVTENPPTMDDNTFNGNYYKINGTVYEKLGSADDAKIEAVNMRRSYLNLTKAVAETDAPADAFFEYTVKITDANAADVWFSAYDPVAGGTVMDLQVTGATAEEGTGYWFAKSGSEFTIKMEAGWNVRFINLVTGTTYEITEKKDSFAPGFVFDKVEAVGNDGYKPTVADTKISGGIDEANTDYTVTYTNKYLGFFYVYHSSDCSVERIYLTDSRVKDGKFDIYAETAEGTLYGGYYKNYAGKSEGFDASKLDYSGSENPKDAGKAYDLAYIKSSNKAAWASSDEYTVIGTAMTPEQDMVYYLKEVPTAYLNPYNYYTYYKADNKVADMWAISALDDLNYSDAGFYITNKLTKTTSVVSSLSIKAQNSKTTVKLTAFKAFNYATGMQDGYLSYAKISSYVGSGDVIMIRQYWKTPDGIVVYGTVMRELNTAESSMIKGKIVYENKPFSFDGFTPTEKP